jgi:hypothetical protein
LVFMPYNSAPAGSPHFITISSADLFSDGKSLDDSDRPDFYVTIRTAGGGIGGRGSSMEPISRTLYDYQPIESRNQGAIAVAVGLASVIMTFVRFAYSEESTMEDKFRVFKRAPLMRSVLRRMCNEKSNVLEPDLLWKTLLMHSGKKDSSGRVISTSVGEEDRKRRMKKLFDGILEEHRLNDRD